MNGARRHGTLLILFVTTFPQMVASMVCMAPPIMAREIGESLGLPSQVVGAYIGILYAGVIVTTSGTTNLISRFGPLRTSLGCVVLAGLGLVLFAAGNALAALVATIIVGLSYGPLTPASSHVIRDLRGSAALAFIMSVRQTSVPLGGVLAGLIVPPLVLANGWEATCIVLGLSAASVGLAVGLGIPLIRRETTRGARIERGSGVFGAIRFVLRRPRVTALAALSLVLGAMQVILSSFLVIYLTAAAHVDLVTAGVLLGVSQVASVLGRLAWGVLADRVRPRRVLAAIGILIALASVLTGLFSPNWPIAWITAVVILFGATASGWNGVFLAEIMRETEPGQVSLVTGGSLIFTYCGVLVGPVLFAAIATLFGFADAFIIMAVIVAAGSAAMLRDDPLARRQA